MFEFFIMSIITLMHIYVFWRISSVPLVKRRVSRKILIGAGVDDLTYGYHSFQVSNPLFGALENRPADLIILLSHTPWQADRAVKANGLWTGLYR